MKKLFLSLCLLLAPSVSYADTDPHDLNPDQRTALTECHDEIKAVTNLETRNVLNKETADHCRQSSLVIASKIVGRNFSTIEEFNSYLTEANQTVGFGIFLNTLIVLAGIILLLALVSLILLYLWPILFQIPVGVYEVAAYAVTAVFLLGAFYWQPFDIWVLKIQPIWFVIPGAFAIPACITLSRFLHTDAKSVKEVYEKGIFADNKDGEVYMGPGFITFPVVLFGLCTIVWGGLAIAYHDQLPNSGVPYFLAFIAIMALESFLGFSVITMPGCIALGWTKDSEIPRSTMASFILLAFYVSIKLTSHNAPEWLNLFSTGCLFMGAFVYFLGLLVMSSKWYSWKDEGKKVDRTVRSGFNRYLTMQGITLASGFAALYFGASFDIGTLLGIGGTFFAIYLLEKYYEIPWAGTGWAWSLLGMAIGMYFFIGFASQNPQYFVWGIK